MRDAPCSRPLGPIQHTTADPGQSQPSTISSQCNLKSGGYGARAAVKSPRINCCPRRQHTSHHTTRAASKPTTNVPAALNSKRHQLTGRGDPPDNNLPGAHQMTTYRRQPPKTRQIGTCHRLRTHSTSVQPPTGPNHRPASSSSTQTHGPPKLMGRPS